MGEFIVPESVRTLLHGATPVDLVVGVLTFNDKATAPGVARALADGCAKAFPQRRTLMVNCDAGSQDDTPQHIQKGLGVDAHLWTICHPVQGASRNVLSESGVPGRETAVRILAAVADQLGATACLVVDGNLKSVDATWTELLAAPILDKGVDCVLPWFQRNRYEGTLTNTLLAPLTRALYGKQIPYHLGGAYAFSGSMIRSTLLQQPWDEEIMPYGIDGWVTTLAVAEPLQICLASLGPRLQQAKPMGDLASVVAQAVGCLFHLMERYPEKWESVAGSVAVQAVGTTRGLGAETGAINVERMVNGFRQGLRDLVPVWHLILSEETFQQVLELGVEETDRFRFSSALWVQVVYDFALAYHDRLLHREHLLKALTPLYLGYTASFIIGTRAQGVDRVEQELTRLSEQFETMKPYFVQRWRWHNE
ncbi:MAG: glycosyl transferase family 2 [Nitrospirota bacterium]|nr:glycosyl transferase family 2 [Nitrospirota bacterium]MDP3599196.1 glycosyl transferase family 2 [Nitrospirota bacterium]